MYRCGQQCEVFPPRCYHRWFLTVVPVVVVCVRHLIVGTVESFSEVGMEPPVSDGGLDVLPLMSGCCAPSFSARSWMALAPTGWMPVSLLPMSRMFAPERVVFTFSATVHSHFAIHRPTISLGQHVSASKVDGAYREFRWCWMSRVGYRVFISL